MQLWRVSRHLELDGLGGLLVSGRWHSKGHPVVYAAEHAATAQLEWLVHLELSPEEYPAEIPFLEIDAPDGISRRELTATDLPAGWERDEKLTRAVGDLWLQNRESALLIVPSKVAPARNVLINPLHPDARLVSVVRSFTHPLDARLK